MSESKLSAETVARLRGLMERATPGPYYAHKPSAELDDFTACWNLCAGSEMLVNKPSIELAAAAVNALPALLSAAEDNERMRAALRDMVTLADAGDVCGSKCPRYAECLTPANAGRCVMLDEARAALAPADEGSKP